MTQTITKEDLSLIAALSRKEPSSDEIYTFAVRLCDNEVDRDCERFDDDTLAELAPMFVGKSGIFDHDWSAKNQTARIFKTEVITEPSTTTSDGLISRWLKGHAYMLRGGNETLISEIEAGIKREVSVGCSVADKRCSICGGDIGGCGHRRGDVYDGKTCHAILCGAKDAFEWSFVAVPAQKKSGVTKSKKMKERGTTTVMTLKELAQQGGNTAAAEYTTLTSEAEFGRAAIDVLRKEAARLASAVAGIDSGTAHTIAASLAPNELGGFNEALARLADKQFGTAPQLRGGEHITSTHTSYTL